MSDKSNRAKWWKVEDFELSFSAPFGSHPEGDWLPATVPGGVYEDLMAAGRLPHPYRDRHEADVRWVEQRSWWYRATLHRPDMPDGHHLVLNFAGIDTVATVWIGGQERARHASQFRPLQVPLDALPDQAELLIRFDPPLAGLTEPEGPRATRDRMRAYFQAQGAFVGDELPSGVMSANMAVTLRRKALFSWGWDFAPHLPSIGLTGPVTLLAVPDSHINDVFWQTLEVKGEDAPARARLQVEVTARKPGQDLRWVLRDAEGQVTAQGQLGGAEETEVNIEHARLWWTHDLGQPSLYDLTVELSEGNEVIDRHT